MTLFQNEVVELLHSILQNDTFRKNHSTPGFKEIVNSILRQFPEITTNGKKTWKKIPLYLKHHKITERASKIINTNDINDKECWKKLHYEHICPISTIITELFELKPNPSKDEIMEIIGKNEIVILSKEESEVLDGSKSKLYDLEGEKVYGLGMRSKGDLTSRLKALDAKLDPKYLNNKL